MQTDVGDEGRSVTLSTPMLLVLSMIAGLLLGAAAAVWWLWACFMLLSAVWAAHVQRRGGKSAQILAFVALAAAAATWGIVRNDFVPADDLRHMLDDEPQLAQFQGVVHGEPYESRSAVGAFAKADYRGPVMLFVLEVDHALHPGGEMRPASGLLLVRLKEQDHRIDRGDRIAATGWLTPIRAPSNPGELDYRKHLERLHIYAMLTLPNRGSWELIARAGEASRSVDGIRRDLSDAAARSLRIGMDDPSPRIALLDAILLGRKSWELNELFESFRQVGLTHVLAISGAHLAILVTLVWVVVRLIVARPSYAACVVLTVLGMYLFALPMRTPIVRAGIMAAIFLCGYGFGRRWRGADLLALAAVAVLIWRPDDLWTPGFQLSFGIVGAMILFTEPLAACLYQPMIAAGEDDTAASTFARWGAKLLAANIVAFLTAMPLVAYHFQLINPLAMVVTLFALPAVTAVLAAGYVKIIVGFVLPSFGEVFAPLTRWLAQVLVSLAEAGGRWHYSAIPLPRQPSALWTAATLLVVVATLHRGWRVPLKSLACAWAMCALWLVVDMQSDARWVALLGDEPAVTVHMYSVGDGSCYLLRFKAADNAPGHVMMVDCGSQAYFDLAVRSIIPALREQGVGRIDTLVVTHADLDHFCGVLDVADAFDIGRVLVPPQLLEQARDEPWSVVGVLVDGLTEQGLVITPITRGWREQLGAATVEAIWPRRDVPPEPSNDTSIVLSIRAAGRRVLLNGDIQDSAIEALLESAEDLRADVTDLPHHGSFEKDLSPRWLDRVSPRVLLQSSGRARLSRDAWEAWIDESEITRLITARHGMVTLEIATDGAMNWRTTHARHEPESSRDTQVDDEFF